MADSGIFKNRYKIPEEEFTMITRMSEAEMGSEMEKSYIHWQTEVEQKKKDPQINLLVEQKKGLRETVEKDPEVVKAVENLKNLRFSKTSEEMARIDSELANARQPVNESIKLFRSKFYTLADIKTKRFQGK